MKRLIFNLLLILSANTFAYGQCKDFVEELSDVKFSEQLAVNSDNEFKLISYFDMLEGHRQLARLAKTAESEELWAYLPECLMWIEVGLAEKTTEKKQSVSKNIEILELVFKSFNKVHIYHIHPNSLNRPSKKSLTSVANLSKVRTEKKISDYTIRLQAIKLAQNSMFSANDIVAGLSDAENFFSINNQAEEFSFRVVTPIGFSQASIIDHNTFDFKKIQNYAAVYELLEHTFSPSLRSARDVIEEAEFLPENDINPFYELLEEIGLKVKYSPFGPLTSTLEASEMLKNNQLFFRD